MKPILMTTCMLMTVLAGCTGTFDALTGDGACDPEADPPRQAGTPAPIDLDANCDAAYVAAGFDGENWPDLSGHTVKILDHGAFDWAFSAAKPAFENLTGAKVENVPADDAGTALQLAIQDQEAGGGSFDILYGIDNVLMSKAAEGDIFEPYTPLLADQVASEHRFAPTAGGAWLATPADHGYIAVNVDPRSELDVATMDDLVTHADQFVTMDPRFSSPGLGFLVATVAVYGEDGYLQYWEDLLDGGVTITQGWTEGYVDRFSGGYGQFEDGSRSDKPIVTSYTTSPAYEMFYGYDVQNEVLLAPESTFQQIQTMGILRGADRIAAQAWIEFTLSDAFQELAAEYNAIYPVVEDDDVDASVTAVYDGNDPDPATFEPASFTSQELGRNIDDWVEGWVDLYESKQA